MDQFGARLKQARVQRGLTQERLGAAVGVTKSSVSAWERGGDRPSFESLPKLREALGTSLDALFANDVVAIARTPRDASTARTEAEAELLARFRELPRATRDAVLELIKVAGPASKRR